MDQNWHPPTITRINMQCECCGNRVEDNLHVVEVTKFSFKSGVAIGNLTRETLNTCARKVCSDCWVKIFMSMTKFTERDGD